MPPNPGTGSNKAPSGTEIGSVATLTHMVKSGLGLAIVPVAIASPPPAGTILRHVHEVDLGLQVGLVHSPDSSSTGRALEALLTSIRQYLRQES